MYVTNFIFCPVCVFKGELVLSYVDGQKQKLSEHTSLLHTWSSNIGPRLKTPRTYAKFRSSVPRVV